MKIAGASFSLARRGVAVIRGGAKHLHREFIAIELEFTHDYVNLKRAVHAKDFVVKAAKALVISGIVDGSAYGLMALHAPTGQAFWSALTGPAGAAMGVAWSTITKPLNPQVNRNRKALSSPGRPEKNRAVAKKSVHVGSFTLTYAKPEGSERAK